MNKCQYIKTNNSKFSLRLTSFRAKYICNRNRQKSSTFLILRLELPVNAKYSKIIG